MSAARVVVPAAPHALIRKGRASFHAAVALRPAGVGPLVDDGPLVFRTACGEELSAVDATLTVWRGAAAATVLERAVHDEPAKICRRCDRVGASLGETK